MIVTLANQSYDCIKAIRQGDNATLYLVSGDTVEFVGVSETGWAEFTLTDGQWEMIQEVPSNQERLDALEAAVFALMGAM